jgi:hypothetical protein
MLLVSDLKFKSYIARSQIFRLEFQESEFSMTEHMNFTISLTFKTDHPAPNFEPDPTRFFFRQGGGSLGLPAIYKSTFFI